MAIMQINRQHRHVHQTTWVQQNPLYLNFECQITCMMAVHVQRMYTISIEYLLLQSKHKKVQHY